MRARYPCLQVRSDNEEAWRHVLKDACEQVHLEWSNTRLETSASNGRGENSVPRWVLNSPSNILSFALLVRHSEWILNHVVRNDFLVELDSRVIFSIVSWSVDVTMTTNDHDFSKLGLSV